MGRTAIRWRRWTARSQAAISVYAQGDDYHDLIKRRLKQLAGALQARLGGEVKVFVDTAPLMEKPLAEAGRPRLAGQAHQPGLARVRLLALPGRRPDHAGADARRAERATTAAPAAPASTSARPSAFPAPYQLDARACLSYLTIEHAGPIPERYRAALGNRIYGCDDCLAVCPWNKFAQASHEATLHAREALRAARRWPTSRRWTTPAFRALFAKSPIKRIGRDRFVRNVLYAIGNSGDAGAGRGGARRGWSDAVASGARRRRLGAGAAQAAARPAPPASRTMNAAPRSIWATSTYSSGWWAWSIEPGPQSTAEKPASWNWPASEAKETAAGRAVVAGQAAHEGLGGAVRLRRAAAARRPAARPRTPASGARALISASSRCGQVEEAGQADAGVEARQACAGRSTNTHSRARMLPAVPPAILPMVRRRALRQEGRGRIGLALQPLGQRGQRGHQPRPRP